MTDRRPAREFFTAKIVMSPMATGGNLPYRRLCREFGADLTCSEMVLADKLVRRKRSEWTLLRSHPSEESFGVQLCGKSPEIVAEAARLAAEHGCRFLDLNFGCPIELIIRRGAGAALLKRPALLERIVVAVREAVDLPLSVKLRAGWSEKEVNAVAVARRCEEAGADAIGVHGRTRERHYRKSADWELIDRVAAAVQVPVLGNGDLLTPWDVELRREQTRIRSFLVARGALIKPWIFTELRSGTPLPFGAADRWRVMRRYFEFAAEHFGDDTTGLQRVRRFFLWHLGFWHRYRSYTEEDWRAARPRSLIQTRGEPVAADGDEALLASADEQDHLRIFERVQAGDFPC